MKTISLNVTPTANLNSTVVNIDLHSFDPHVGPSFWLTFYNSSGYVIDRKVQTLPLEDWQNWGAEDDELADYVYLANKVTEAAGISYDEMTSPSAPAPEPTIEPTLEPAPETP